MFGEERQTYPDSETRLKCIQIEGRLRATITKVGRVSEVWNRGEVCKENKLGARLVTHEFFNQVDGIRCEAIVLL
jgi:hypothetical protein